MAQIFLNNARGTLTTSIDNLATSLTLEAVVGFPASLASGDYFLLTLYADTTRYGENIEVVKVTGLTDNGDGTWTLTVERGHEFAAVSHVAQERAESRLTAGTMDRMDQPNDWPSITDKPATATRWPMFTEVTSKPASYPPDGHSHPLSEITDSGTAATHNVPATGDAATTEVVKGDDTRLSDARSPTSHSHQWDDVTAKPYTATRWPSFEEVTRGSASMDRYDLSLASITSNIYIDYYHVVTIDATTAVTRDISFFGSTYYNRAQVVVATVTGSVATITWPVTVYWSGGSAPDLNASWTTITFHWNGDEWYGFKSGGAD